MPGIFSTPTMKWWWLRSEAGGYGDERKQQRGCEYVFWRKNKGRDGEMLRSGVISFGILKGLEANQGLKANQDQY